MFPTLHLHSHPDNELLPGLCAGREDVYAAFYRQFWRPLRAYAERVVGSPDDADDLAQSVLIYLFVHRDTWPIRKSVTGYLYSAVRNSARNNFRRNRLHDGWTPSVSDRRDSAIDAQNPLSDDQLDADERHARAIALLNRLPPRCRAAALLVHAYGLSYDEAAVHLGVARSTIHTHLLRAKRLARTIAANRSPAKNGQRVRRS
jgi:RNA polymerase sigma-70 factor (ECF subfamily)